MKLRMVLPVCAALAWTVATACSSVSRKAPRRRGFRVWAVTG
jgi:hypothetical protein